GVICASDLNKPETRVLSPQKQQEINNINQQFVNIQNTQITDIDNVINTINTVTTTTTTAITPPPPQNGTGGGTTALSSSPRDTIPPVVTVPPNLTLDATGAEGALGIYVLTAQDNVDGTARLENGSSLITQDNVGGNIAISCAPPSASVFPVGTTTVQCSATDAAGNRGTASFTVAVRADTTPPTLIGPEDVVFTPTSDQSGRATYTITAEDNVDGTAKLEADGITVTQDNVGGSITISCDIPSGSEFLSGETILTCVATDQAGNAFRDSVPLTVTPGEEDEGETAQVEEEEPPSPPPTGEEVGEGETTDAEELLPLPPTGEEQQPPSEEEEEEEENEGETTEE
nr:HYR domain-containing protein [Thermoproteota archaeon]